MIGGRVIPNASPTDIAMRIQIIECLVELMSEEEVNANDVVDCLDEYMETNFNTLCDEFSHDEMA